MVKKSRKKQKENPVGYTGEGKRWKGKRYREDKTVTACISVWRWGEPCEVGSHKGQLRLSGFDLRNYTRGVPRKLLLLSLLWWQQDKNGKEAREERVTQNATILKIQLNTWYFDEKKKAKCKLRITSIIKASDTIYTLYYHLESLKEINYILRSTRTIYCFLNDLLWSAIHNNWFSLFVFGNKKTMNWLHMFFMVE